MALQKRKKLSVEGVQKKDGGEMQRQTVHNAKDEKKIKLVKKGLLCSWKHHWEEEKNMLILPDLIRLRQILMSQLPKREMYGCKQTDEEDVAKSKSEWEGKSDRRRRDMLWEEAAPRMMNDGQAKMFLKHAGIWPIKIARDHK